MTLKLKILIITVITLSLFTGCGDSPQGLPGIDYGDLRVTAVFNNTPADSVSVTLDDEFLGTFDNPYTIYNIEAGTHKVFAGFNNLIGEAELVSVEQNAVTDVTIELSGTGPYAGYYAPDFVLTDLSDAEFRLSDHTGKVILLFFFEHT
ncbi:MAG: hypothetical protein GY863_05275 [bacterium]|nr:hypothetical protein [bacterium]